MKPIKAWVVDADWPSIRWGDKLTDHIHGTRESARESAYEWLAFNPDKSFRVARVEIRELPKRRTK